MKLEKKNSGKQKTFSVHSDLDVTDKSFTIQEDHSDNIFKCTEEIKKK